MKENKNELMKIDIEQSIENNKIVYELSEEKLIIPDTNAEYSMTKQKII